MAAVHSSASSAVSDLVRDGGFEIILVPDPMHERFAHQFINLG
jgi:hypothetical protein